VKTLPLDRIVFLAIVGGMGYYFYREYQILKSSPKKLVSATSFGVRG
jgi:hypothetical protein